MKIYQLKSQIIVYTLILAPFLAYGFRSAGINFDYVLGFILFLISLDTLIACLVSPTPIKFPLYLKLYTLFTVYTLFTEMFISHIAFESSFIKYLYSNYYLLTCIAFFVVENSFFESRLIQKTINLLQIFIFIVLAVAIIQQFDPLFFVHTSSENVDIFQGIYSGRVFSIYTWTRWNELGFGFISIVSVLFGSSLYSGKPKYWIPFIGVMTSILSWSRYIMINSVIIIFQVLMNKRNLFYSTLKILFVTVSILIISFFVLGYLGMDTQRFIEERLFDDSALTRLLAFEVFFKEYPKNPVWGTGGILTQSTYLLIAGKSSHIHVGWLSLFYYYGFVGGIIYLTFMYTLIRKFYKTATFTGYWGSFYTIVAFTFANATLTTLDFFWYGLILSFIFEKYFSQHAQNILYAQNQYSDNNLRQGKPNKNPVLN